MIGTIGAAAIGLVALALQVGASGLEGFRARLEAPSAAEREIATAELRRSLADADVPAALAALSSWPPTPALHLRSVLVAAPLARRPLLELACDPGGDASRGALARDLLLEAFRLRADEQAPFRAELDTSSEPRLPWSDHGLWVRRTGAPKARLAWPDVRRELARAGAWTQPLVLFPGVERGELAAPSVEQAPASAWLEVELSRRDLAPVRGAIATWIVPAALAPSREPSSSSRPGSEVARLLAGEQQLLQAALLALAIEPPFERGRDGADLLAQLGLPCFAGDREDEFARGVKQAEQDRRGAAGSSGGDSAKQPDGARRASDGERSEPHGGSSRATPASEDPRTSMSTCLDRIVAAKADPATARAQLREQVDAIAGRLAAEPLLGGDLAALLRGRAAGLADADPLRAELDRSAHELWILGRGARPGTRLLDLPRGVPAD